MCELWFTAEWALSKQSRFLKVYKYESNNESFKHQKKNQKQKTKSSKIRNITIDIYN